MRRRKRCANTECMGHQFPVTTAQDACVVCGGSMVNDGPVIPPQRLYADREREVPKTNPLKDFLKGQVDGPALSKED